MSVPDYIEPTVGWRVWDVVEEAGALRLRSPAFLTIWLPRREAMALCRRSFPSLYSAGLPDHLAPHERCSCGLYATQRAADAAPYLSRLFTRRHCVLHRVMGRVSLWGSVVECRRGWRASRAYPVSLYVPTARKRLLSFLTRLPPPLLPAEEIALGLADYGVPIEVVDCATPGEVVAAVESARTAQDY